jgi:diphthine synthase
MLAFVGLGLGAHGLTLEGLEALRASDIVLLDVYTAPYDNLRAQLLRAQVGRELILATRKELEGGGIRKIIQLAKEKDVAIAVSGDPFLATTHVALKNEALEAGVHVLYIPGVSIVSAAFAVTGLQVYKMGPVATIVGPSSQYRPKSSYLKLYRNLQLGLHSLLLLGYDGNEEKYITISVARELIVSELAQMRVHPDRLIALGLSGIGEKGERIHFDKLTDISAEDTGLPQCIIIPGYLDDIETKTLILLGVDQKLILQHGRELKAIGGKVHLER